jgi:hypothetical protein
MKKWNFLFRWTFSSCGQGLSAKLRGERERRRLCVCVCVCVKEREKLSGQISKSKERVNCKKNWGFFFVSADFRLSLTIQLVMALVTFIRLTKMLVENFRGSRWGCYKQLKNSSANRIKRPLICISISCWFDKKNIGTCLKSLLTNGDILVILFPWNSYENFYFDANKWE